MSLEDFEEYLIELLNDDADNVQAVQEIARTGEIEVVLNTGQSFKILISE